MVKNFHQTSLENPFTPVMVFISPDFGWIPYHYISVKVDGHDVARTLAAIQHRWGETFQDSPMTYYFLDEYFGQQYAQEELYEKTFMAASLFAICIACLGLFGVTYYTIALKKKEIGVRKVLGASVASLLGLFSRTYLHLLVLAFVMITPISYLVLDQWLSHYSFRTALGVLPFFIPLLLLGPIILFKISGLTLRAAAANPTDSLRYE